MNYAQIQTQMEFPIFLLILIHVDILQHENVKGFFWVWLGKSENTQQICGGN